MVAERRVFVSQEMLRFSHSDSFAVRNLTTFLDQWDKISVGYEKRDFVLAIIRDDVDVFDFFTGADPGFFLRGGATLRNDVTDGEVKKLKANTHIRRRKLHLRGRGVSQPLHPSPRSAPASPPLTVPFKEKLTATTCLLEWVFQIRCLPSI